MLCGNLVKLEGDLDVFPLSPALSPADGGEGDHFFHVYPGFRSPSRSTLGYYLPALRALRTPSLASAEWFLRSTLNIEHRTSGYGTWNAPAGGRFWLAGARDSTWRPGC